MSANDITRISIGPIYGAMLGGCIVSMVLYGLALMQMIMYLSTFYKEDHWSTVATVCILWFFQTVHMYCVGNFLYYNLVTNYCDPIWTTTKLEDVTPGVEALITFIVHCFYARRVWILSMKNRWIAGIVSILAITHFGFELSFCALGSKFPQYDQSHITGPYVTTAVALAAGLDILIAGTIVYLLNLRRTDIKSTQIQLKKIAAVVVGSGALTSITDVVILICLYAVPNNAVWLGIYVLICDLYAISMLTSLNTRAFLRNSFTEVHHVSLQMVHS